MPKADKDLSMPEWYDESFGANLDLSKVDIHHVKSLVYGGDNTMQNLIPLPKLNHTGVTGL